MAKRLTVFPKIAHRFRGGTTKPTENQAVTQGRSLEKTRASWTFYLVECADCHLDILWLDYIDHLGIAS